MLLKAKRRKQEEMEKQKQEDQAKRQQERELKRQQAILLKEQERERRRQHTTFIRQLDARKRWEERERRKHQNLLDRLLAKEKKLQQRRREMELLSELRRPQEDSTLSDQKPLPNLQRIPGLKLPGQAMADVLQVFEFIYNFGQTLGFDLESVPTLNTFQTALLPDCGPEAEEELMQVLTQLLVCAIEDPGIPHPGRHTTLLGHPIRMGDITNANISEILRIYLYANATGEVKSLTGLTAERERERRVADHHQTDAEMQVTCTSTKNAQYYEHLHSNSTYKLSEALRDKPFLALNATTKAKILAFLCNELLQNKAVLRQIDTSLENLNQLKKERYLMDMKIRKIKVLHQRKVRTEQAERQQALALERMQRLVEESTAESALTHTRDEVDLSTPAPIAVDHHNDTIKEALSKESSPQRDSVTEKGLPPEMQSPYKDGLEKEESDKELSPLKENGLKNKELLNNNKEECSPADNKLDKDSVMGDCDTILSDLESEGTQPEEDEDKNLSSEELARKLERLLRQSEQQLQQLAAASHALRATCYGQDRYWRRYWSLGRCGGIFVEAMESAQPEIMVYHAGLENAVVGKTEQKQVRKTGKRDQTTDIRVESQKSEDQLKSEIELKNIKSELNLSDHTQIIKYEPNLRHGACKAEGSPIKMEEKYIQHKQSKDEEDMLDIEDSIPTAFLVQKPTHKPMFATQAENLDKPQEIVKIENVVKGEVAEEQEPDESKDQLVNNLEELRKMAEAVSSQLDAAKKAENEIQEEMEKDKMDVAEPKEEIMEPEVAYAYLYTKMLEGKWFSILRKENSFLTNTNDLSIPEKYLSDYSQKIPTYVDNDQTCSEIILCQGHKWDVSNNLHLLHDPSLFTLNSMVTCVPVPANNIYADSSLTMSGLDQDMMDASLHRDKNDVEVLEQQHNEMKEENDLEKELHEDALKSDGSKLKNNNLMTLGLLNFNALSTYVTCDSPPPLQMSPDEIEQLEYCKVHGLPKKLDGNFVPKELSFKNANFVNLTLYNKIPKPLKPRVRSLTARGWVDAPQFTAGSCVRASDDIVGGLGRHGWWRITDPDQMRELLEALHPRGVRERELHAAFMQYLPTVNNKLYIDKGDLLSTDLSISHLDRVIAQNGGYPSPDSPGSYSAHTARRVDAAVLEMVEQLEERIAAASMQVKGWRPSRVPPPEEASGAELVARARHKLAAVEAHIERRYLKPPLVQSTQGGATNRSSTSNHNWE
ncbi:Bromodomain adjacent to zinc finger domain protein 2B [Eumeta japonica]|uniref:Bromodomain adjacent to zinc finger domain protein 2B n=1 Tax=Eumeta variegata TaxID=151549 RepID=A0A4C1XS04_EUMVA|nr:Bromodomain adjacent to zinc finger domain protein 2B [Eumeta japonica]